MTSTINTSIPATNSALTSAPIRANFTAAANDINGIQTILSGLGNMSTQSQNNVTITGGIIAANGAGITHLTAANIDAGTAGINISGNAGTVTTINGKIAAGTNVTLSGSGTSVSPYVISSSGSGGTVTSVGVVADGFFLTASGSPITTSGAITLSDAVHPAFTLIGNPSGSIAAPTDIELAGTLLFSGDELHTAAFTGDITTTSNSFVTTIANNAVTTAKISANAVTNAKMANGPINSLVGYDAAGAFSDVAIGANLTLSGGILNATGGGGGGSPGGVQYDVQLNDGAGGFAGSNNLNFQGGFLTINGDSGYGQLQWLNSPLTGGYAGSGINGIDGEIILGALAGDLSIWASQSISFGGNTGGSIQLGIDGATGKINIPQLTPSELTATDASSNLQSLDVTTYPSLTEISYVKGVTSAIQTQINGKQPTGSYLTAVTSNAPLSGSGTSASHLVISQSTTSTDGYLSSTDWNTFNGKGAGTITAVSVASANGFAGSSSGGTTPALTISTSITGILLGNGTAISASVVTNDIQTKAAVVPNTAPSAGQILVGNAGGTVYAPVSMSSDATLDSTGAITIASHAVTYAKMQQASTVTLLGNPTGGAANISEITLGSGLAFSGTTLTATGGGTGTVTTTGSPANGNLTKFSGSTSITNGDLSGDITTSGALATTLATVNANVGSFGSATQTGTFTVNGKGLTTAASNVTITPAIGSITGLGTGVATFLSTPSSANLAAAVTDETGTGALVFGTSPTIATASLGSSTATTQTPSDNSTKLATTAYVDAAVLGQNFKEAALVATTANLVGVYLSNVFTYTATGTNAIDGVTLALGNRVLVKDQTTTFQNGIYSVTTAGAIGIAGVLTRSTDANTSGEFKTGDSIFITSGTVNKSTTWAYTGVDSPTLGTDAITYVQAAGLGTYTQGNGITITGASIAIDTSVTLDKTTAQIVSNKTFVAPALGTPASGVATNLTGTASSLTAGAVTNATFTTALTVNTGTLTLTASSANTSVLTIGAGAVSVSNANTGDQTFTLTGAVTGSGTGSFATTIATPGTLTVSTSNSTATAHTHAITSSSAPGAAASILATDSSGIIGSTGTRIVKIWAADLTVSNSIAGSITGNAATVTTNANLTGAVTSSGNATTLITGIPFSSGSTTAVGNQTFYLVAKAPFAGTINILEAAQTTSGTITAAIKINGTNVTGLSAVSVTSTPADTNATAANTFAIGDIVTLVTSSASSDLGFSFLLKITRT